MPRAARSHQGRQPQGEPPLRGADGSHKPKADLQSACGPRACRPFTIAREDRTGGTVVARDPPPGAPRASIECAWGERCPPWGIPYLVGAPGGGVPRGGTAAGEARPRTLPPTANSQWVGGGCINYARSTSRRPIRYLAAAAAAASAPAVRDRRSSPYKRRRDIAAPSVLARGDAMWRPPLVRSRRAAGRTGACRRAGRRCKRRGRAGARRTE